MKKIAFFMSALALAFAFTACDTDNGPDSGDIDWDNLTLDGFYVYGPATGSDEVLAVNAMAAGSNEVEKAVRQGMYEKYIYLEAGKDFALVDNKAGELTYYGANLAEVNYGKGTEENPGKNFDQNPNMTILQGKLIVGKDAPKMRVSKSALYHIVLDNNSKGDLAYPQIVVQEAAWGVRGDMNGGKFTEGTPVYNEDGTIVYTWTEQQIDNAGGKFKFASCFGWKINLDEDGLVKAEVSFGVFEGKLNHVAKDNDIVVAESGRYTITLTYKPAAGALTDAFTYSMTRTGDAIIEYTENLYINGAQFGGEGWDWGAETIATMYRINGETGKYWAVRYLEPGKGFKFAPAKNWDTSFSGEAWSTHTGVIFNGGNAEVKNADLYLIFVDQVNQILEVIPAEIYGIGNAFGSWDTATYAFDIADDGKATINVTATVDGIDSTVEGDGHTGGVRMYAKYAGYDWWKMEFVVLDGKIVYRGNGGDQQRVAATAGQTVTLDFNAGTGSIQ